MQKQCVCFCAENYLIFRVFSMDASSVSVLWYKRSKPVGKVRRRVQDLRVPSTSFSDYLAIRPALDASHNESARLAVDCLLTRGIESYHEMLNAEGEVDFLSQLEKSYILENGRGGNTDDPSASDDKDFESLSTGSWCDTHCPAVSTDSESTDADAKLMDSDLVRSGVEIYFQSDSKAASLKDLVREFIRKANVALAIVMDIFSDVELLCDLLETSRKRNVYVYLLLDHLNLNLFVNMWQSLKLNSKNFPKLLVCSVDGQTYCAKTGRKLTGQIAENLIIADWTEVLTGSYSFSWLSWQVHRSLAVLVKGSAVTSFHQEFHRLYFSSKPVPGFVTFITVPHMLPLYATLPATQNNNSSICKSKSSQAKKMSHWPWTEDVHYSQHIFSNAESPELEHSKGNIQLPYDSATDEQKHTQPRQLYPKPIVPPGTKQSVCVEKPKHRVSNLHDVQTYVELMEENPDTIQSLTRHLGVGRVSHMQSQLAGLSISTTAERNVRDQDLNPLNTANATHQPHGTEHYQSAFTKNPSQILSEKLSLRSPPTPQQKQAKSGLQVLLSHSGHSSGLRPQLPSLGTKRHDQHLTTDTPGFMLTPATSRTHLQPQLQTHSTMFSPGAAVKLQLQPRTFQQANPPPRFNWMVHSHTARIRPVSRTSSFDSTYGTGHTAGLLGWRQRHSNMTSLARSKSLTESHT